MLLMSKFQGKGKINIAVVPAAPSYFSVFCFCIGYFLKLPCCPDLLCIVDIFQNFFCLLCLHLGPPVGNTLTRKLTDK